MGQISEGPAATKYGALLEFCKFGRAASGAPALLDGLLIIGILLAFADATLKLAKSVKSSRRDCGSAVEAPLYLTKCAGIVGY
jgi:hypothetical protein